MFLVTVKGDLFQVWMMNLQNKASGFSVGIHICGVSPPCTLQDHLNIGKLNLHILSTEVRINLHFLEKVFPLLSDIADSPAHSPFLLSSSLDFSQLHSRFLKPARTLSPNNSILRSNSFLS